VPPSIVEMDFELSNSNKTTPKEFFLSDREWALYCSVVCFFEFFTPFTLGGHNFLNSNIFLTIFNAPNVPMGEIQVLFGHQKQQSA
jgi:hypothetical protein